MLKTISISVLALAVAGFAGSAMADSEESAAVDVNINVLPIVSVWADASAVDLNIHGGPNNAAAANDTIHLLNNVPFDLNVKVTGSLHAGIHFFVSGNNSTDAATIETDVNSDFINSPAMKYSNTYEWVAADVAAGASHTLISDETTLYRTAALSYPVAYIATAPGGPPAVTGSTPDALTVTYTITAQ